MSAGVELLLILSAMLSAVTGAFTGARGPVLRSQAEAAVGAQICGGGGRATCGARDDGSPGRRAAVDRIPRFARFRARRRHSRLRGSSDRVTRCADRYPVGKSTLNAVRPVAAHFGPTCSADLPKPFSGPAITTSLAAQGGRADQRARADHLGDDRRGTRNQTPILRGRLEGESLNDILPDAFATVREASKRTSASAITTCS